LGFNRGASSLFPSSGSSRWRVHAGLYAQELTRHAPHKASIHAGVRGTVKTDLSSNCGAKLPQPEFKAGHYRKGDRAFGASQAAKKQSTAVILSPFAVILSAVKNRALPLRVSSAKDLALPYFNEQCEILRRLRLLRMTVAMRSLTVNYCAGGLAFGRKSTISC
jgi:hypothetical protein